MIHKDKISLVIEGDFKVTLNGYERPKHAHVDALSDCSKRIEIIVHRDTEDVIDPVHGVTDEIVKGYQLEVKSEDHVSSVIASQFMTSFQGPFTTPNA